jgi:hypothetical protein
MPEVLLKLPFDCSWNWRYSANQIAMLAALTKLRKPHHRTTGFDQASVTGRACRSMLIHRSACNRIDIEL